MNTALIIARRHNSCDGYEGKGGQLEGKNVVAERVSTTGRHYREDKAARTITRAIRAYVRKRRAEHSRTASKRGSNSSRGSSILGVLTSMAQRARALSITSGPTMKQHYTQRQAANRRKSRAASGIDAALAVKRRSVSASGELLASVVAAGEASAGSRGNRKPSGMLALPDLGSGRRHSSTPLIA